MSELVGFDIRNSQINRKRFKEKKPLGCSGDLVSYRVGIYFCVELGLQKHSKDGLAGPHNSIMVVYMDPLGK